MRNSTDETDLYGVADYGDPALGEAEDQSIGSVLASQAGDVIVAGIQWLSGDTVTGSGAAATEPAPAATTPAIPSWIWWALAGLATVIALMHLGKKEKS